MNSESISCVGAGAAVRGDMSRQAISSLEGGNIYLIRRNNDTETEL